MENILNTAIVSADFSRTNAQIKPLHGVNNSPFTLGDAPAGFREAGFPFCRLHDPVGAWGGTHFVDIPNIFPDFDADPADEKSYDFAFTDAYLSGLHASGTEIFYRLGITIENYHKIRAYHNHPPRDFGRWAEICAGVVRHYNEGWANGFHFGIRYWEIWNEPENPPMWSGTKEEFFNLYKVASLRLKREFPDIRIGGYGSCGFYVLTRKGMSDMFYGFPVWFEEFLSFVKHENLPFDFFSWHLYTCDPAEIIAHARYVREKLTAAGFPRTESIFDEWNYINFGEGTEAFLRMKNEKGAAFTAAAFCLMQNSSVDKAMYYDALPTRAYCGLYDFPGDRVTPAWHAFLAFNELYKLGGQCPAEGGPLAVCAASDGRSAALLAVNFSPDAVSAELNFKNAPGSRFFCRVIDAEKTFAEVPFDGKTFTFAPYSTVLFSSEKTDAAKHEKTAERPSNAGIDTSN